MVNRSCAIWWLESTTHTVFLSHRYRINGIDTCTELLLDTLGEKIANTQDDKGRTPVHAAAFAEQCESLQLLLSNGADVNIMDRLGRSPLMLAAANGNCGAIGKDFWMDIHEFVCLQQIKVTCTGIVLKINKRCLCQCKEWPHQSKKRE